MIREIEKLEKIGKKVYSHSGEYLGVIKSMHDQKMDVEKTVIPIVPFGYRRKIELNRVDQEDINSIRLKINQNEYWQQPDLVEVGLLMESRLRKNRDPFPGSNLSLAN